MRQDMLSHLTRKLLMTGLLVALVGCHHHTKPHTGPPDFRPPLFIVAVEYDGISPGYCPTAEEFSAEYNRVAKCWLDWWAAKPPDHTMRPKGMPGPGEIVRATVTCQRNCDTTADKLGDGYDVTVKAWSCTHDAPQSKQFMISAAGHAMCHLVSGLQCGNSSHDLYYKTCGR